MKDGLDPFGATGQDLKVPETPRGLFKLSDLPLEDLLALRQEITELLPHTKLAEMNLEEELVIQFMTVKALQALVLGGSEEANKKAQVANTVAGVLQNLVKMQTELHTSERLKEIEARFIKAAEKIPEQYLKDFFEWYEDTGV